MSKLDAKIALLEFRPDDTWQHVAIADQELCRDCAGRECLLVCPSAVFRWDHNPDHPVLVLYKQCVECGACRLACPRGNVLFAFPRAGHGVVFHQG